MKIIPITSAPHAPGCVANPPCVGPGFARDCAWDIPKEAPTEKSTPLAGFSYHCSRVPDAHVVVLYDGQPALTHGNNRVRVFRPDAIEEIRDRAKHDPGVDLASLQPLFDQVHRATNGVSS